MKLEIATRYTLVDANSKSNQVIPEAYQEVIELPNYFFALISNGFCKICDSDGNTLHLINTRNVEKFLIYRKPDFICLNIDQKWWFMQKDGRLYVSPYDDIDSDMGTDTLIGVCINGKWGYADSKGTLRVPANYEHFRYFSHSSTLPILVKLDDKFTFYNIANKNIQFELFDSASPFKFEENLNNYVAKVTLNNKQNLLLPNDIFIFDEFVDEFFIYEKQGIITHTGNYASWYTLSGNKIITDCLAIVPQKDSAFFVVKKETGYGITDRCGFFLTDCIYDPKMLLTERLFILQKDGKFVLFKRNTGEVFTPQTPCSKNCSDKDYLDYALKALNYYLS